MGNCLAKASLRYRLSSVVGSRRREVEEIRDRMYELEKISYPVIRELYGVLEYYLLLPLNDVLKLEAEVWLLTHVSEETLRHISLLICFRKM